MRVLATLFIALLGLGAAAGAATLALAGPELAAGLIDDVAAEVLDRPASSLDLERLEKGDLCDIAKPLPDTVPAGFALAFTGPGAQDVAHAAAAVHGAMPMIAWSDRPDAFTIHVHVVEEDLWFEGEDIAGVACRASILIEERALHTSTLTHEVGHVFGLPHDDASWMQVGRHPDDADAWSTWTLEQNLHLATFQAGAEWPDRLDG